MSSISQTAARAVQEEFNRSLKILKQNNKHVCLYFYLFIYFAGEGGGGKLGGDQRPIFKGALSTFHPLKKEIPWTRSK